MRVRPVIFAATCLLAMQAAAIDASNRYRSPRNPERKVRASTELIVLHTTEAPEHSSLNKLSDRGEAHFCVTESGAIYRIVDRDKEAFHAGRSMWNGKEDVDKFSIGIECVGYHDKLMGEVQLKAIGELVAELKSMYNLGDDRVVSHGHVAYGAPNKWHRFKHRGRKRCGMLFAMPSVRRELKLTSRPKFDPDVRAKRLKNADDLLAKALYGNLDTMKRELAKRHSTPSPQTTGIFSWLKRKDPAASQSSPRPSSPPKISPPKTVSPKTVPPKATGQFKTLPTSIAELKKAGYVAKGSVTKDLTAAQIAGDKWNAATTYYTIRDKVVPGNMISPARIEKGMTIWLKP